MRKKIFSLVTALLIVFSLSFQDISVSATGPHTASIMFDFGCHTLSGGVSGRYYWLDSTFSSNSTYSTMVSSATNLWKYTTTYSGAASPVSLARTTTRSQSMFDVLYSSVEAGSGSAGETRMYLFNGTRVNASTSYNNWDYSHIILDTVLWSQLTNNQKQQTITHEFGHALGLAHPNPLYNYTNYITAPSTYRAASTNVPAGGEIEALRHLY